MLGYVRRAVFRSRSRSEPRLFGWSRSRFKIGPVAGAENFGSALAPFFANEKREDLKMFIVHCIL